MILELTFLTGRYHATAWGRHPNEATPEWPPSPFRLLRALLDTWYRKHEDIEESVVDRLLRSLAPPPVFRLPPARSNHTRSFLSQNKEDATDKKLVFDGFAVLDRGSSVLIGWPGLALESDTLDATRRLCGSLGYFGRSESWARIHLIEDRDVAWNCVPLTPGSVPAGKEVVPVAGVIAPSVFDAQPFAVAPKGKGKQRPRELSWLEALGWGSAEAIEHTMNRPPALEPLFYVRNADALEARPAPAVRPRARVVEGVRFAVDAKVRVPITESVWIAEHARRNLMGALKSVLGHEYISATFSGKNPDGTPARGHAHVSILSLDDDGDGYVDGLLIVSAVPMTPKEQRALDRLRPILRRNGHPIVLTPVKFGARPELLSAGTDVVSLTPFAPTQHWREKRDGDFALWLAQQVRLECGRRGLPRPIRIERLPEPLAKERHLHWRDFVRTRKGDAPQPAFGLRLLFAEPVHVPFSLGYASHFGLGTFVRSPVERLSSAWRA